MIAMQRMVTRNLSPLPQLTMRTRILVIPNCRKRQAKNPEKKGWYSKGKGGCYPGEIHQ